MRRRTRPRNPHLAAAMARAGKSILVLAEETGLHRHTISRALNLRSACTHQTAKRLATALGTTAKALHLTYWGV